MDSVAGSIRCERPLLLAVVDGVAPADLAAIAAAAGLPVRTSMPLQLAAPSELAAAILALRPADALRDLGLAVEQRSLCLHPAWRSDEAQLRLLAARPTGPPAVTLLQLREPLLQAALHGPTSRAFGAAVARLPLRLASVGELLRDGDGPETWLLATGAAVPVQRTFHLGAALRRRWQWPFGGRLRITLLPELARIATDSERSRQRLAAVLRAEPFRRYGACIEGGRASDTWFAAADGIAFGDQPWRGRRALSPPAAALLPVPVHTADGLDVSGLVGRFCMRAVALLREPAPVPQRPRPEQALPDLAAVLAAASPPG